MQTTGHHFPDIPPPQIPQCINRTTLNEPVFDPDAHLQLETPELYFTHPLTPCQGLKWPPSETPKMGEIAATTPFRILSDEAAAHVQSRIPETLRGLGMRSKWANDFVLCQRITDLVSEYAGTNLGPHTLTMNRGHVNYGTIGSGQIVDQWHFDSVHYVIVIMISDPPEIGGDLELLLQPKDTGFKMLKDTNNQPPSEYLFQVKFPAAGYGVFLHGSQIMHHVTAVEKALSDRITLVFSYSPIDPFIPDCTIYRSYNEGQEKALHIAPWDFTRHKAFRASKQLHQFVAELELQEDKQLLLCKLKAIVGELQDAIDLVEDKKVDQKQYFDEIDQTKPSLTEEIK